MNTDKTSPKGQTSPSGFKKVLTPEEKARKSELARALRAKKRFEKQVMRDPVIDEEETKDTVVTEDTEDTEDTEVTVAPKVIK